MQVEMDLNKNFRTRIAPSPTGEDIHIGNLYTALINWAFAKKNNGKFIIRIEDTDRERLVNGSEERILETIQNFGIIPDESPKIGGKYAPYRQSERIEIYKKYAEELIEKGHAYYCFCTKERIDEIRKEQVLKKKVSRYDKYCLININDFSKRIEKNEKYVIRLNVASGREIILNDVIRGEIKFQSDLLDDQILIKSDGYPTYHMAVVIDDHLMKISHVIRAEEWISSTPKHILIYEALGWELPIFAHGPILRNPDRSKLSKRKNPVWSSWYLDEGYLPEAVLNYLALMGWSHPEDKEIFSIDEYSNVFELKDIKPVGPIFDINKLKWMNSEYIRALSEDELKKKLIHYDKSLSTLLDDKNNLILLTLAKLRMRTLKDFKILISDPQEIYIYSEEEKKIIEILIDKIIAIKVWEKEKILDLLKKFSIEQNVSMKMMYLFLTGNSKGLPLPEMLEWRGKDITLSNLKKIII